MAVFLRSRPLSFLRASAPLFSSLPRSHFHSVADSSNDETPLGNTRTNFKSFTDDKINSFSRWRRSIQEANYPKRDEFAFAPLKTLEKTPSYSKSSSTDVNPPRKTMDERFDELDKSVDFKLLREYIASFLRYFDSSDQAPPSFPYLYKKIPENSARPQWLSELERIEVSKDSGMEVIADLLRILEGGKYLHSLDPVSLHSLDQESLDMFLSDKHAVRVSNRYSYIYDKLKRMQLKYYPVNKDLTDHFKASEARLEGTFSNAAEKHKAYCLYFKLRDEYNKCLALARKDTTPEVVVEAHSKTESIESASGSSERKDSESVKTVKNHKLRLEKTDDVDFDVETQPETESMEYASGSSKRKDSPSVKNAKKHKIRLEKTYDVDSDIDVDVEAQVETESMQSTNESSKRKDPLSVKSEKNHKIQSKKKDNGGDLASSSSSLNLVSKVFGKKLENMNVDLGTMSEVYSAEEDRKKIPENDRNKILTEVLKLDLSDSDALEVATILMSEEAKMRVFYQATTTLRKQYVTYLLRKKY